MEEMMGNQGLPAFYDVEHQGWLVMNPSRINSIENYIGQEVEGL